MEGVGKVSGRCVSGGYLKCPEVVNVCMYASMQEFKFASMQVCRYAHIHVFKY